MDTTDRLDRLYLFTLIREEPSKEAWLKTLCKHMADVTCKTDAVSMDCSGNPESPWNFTIYMNWISGFLIYEFY